jgi:molybdenum cofactor cytidylyltransferase
LTAPERIAAVVLAAGQSHRFGGDKLLHPLAGRPLGAHIAAMLSAMPFGWRIAVCPASRAGLFPGFEIVDNPDPSRGMGTSLALAAKRAITLGAEAMLVCLADMPFVTGDHLAALIAARGDVVATEAAGVRSPPALFAAAHLPALAQLSGDRGARDLLRDAVAVHAEPGMVRDFDAPEDFT